MTITIYTNYLVVTYNVIFSGSKEELARALDEGSVLLQTKEGSYITINSINASIIEIKDTPLT